MLSFNASNQQFVVFSNDEARAKAVGLTLSKAKFGPKGEKCWFTDSPYAALDYWDEGTTTAKDRLLALRKDYEESWAQECDRKYPCPDDREFMPFQNAGIAYGMRHKNTLIGDEPGLGKTAQSIGIANAMGMERILVVCPAAVRLNWQREVRNWSTIRNVKTYPILKASDGVGNANYVIASYNHASNEALHGAMCESKWDMIVIDEAHFLKDKGAIRTKALFGGGQKHVYSKHVLIDRAEHVVPLTGTPLPNRPRECFTLLKALCPEAIDWQTHDEFAYRYNPSMRLDTGHTFEDQGRLPELQNRLRCNLMVRRLKADVLKDLPDKRYELTYIEPDGAIRDVLARERMLDYSYEDLVNPDSPMFGQISTIRREMGNAKLPRVVQHIQYLIDVVGLNKVLVFFHHRDVMDKFRVMMADYGVVEIRGGMSQGAKQGSLENFIHNKNCHIFSGQMDSAGVGIDGLQGVCSHAVIAEASWVPGVNEQAIDRLYRIGQHDNVTAQFAVVEGSLDERVLAANFDKTQNIHQSLDRRR